MSASGLIVGTVLTGACDRCPYPPPYDQGFTYQNGSYQLVTANASALETWVSGVNDSDQIVGYYLQTTNITGSFMLETGEFTDFGVNPPTGPFNEATGISSQGEIVGSTHSGVLIQGFAIIDGAAIKISVKGQQYTLAQRVNDNGVIVVSYGNPGGPFRGFVNSSGAFSPLNYPGSSATQLTGIDNSGVIVGAYTATDGSSGSFLYNGQVFHRFQLPSACATSVTGINNLGVVYGSGVFGPQCTEEYGFVATPNH